jgi:hypothetical protein
MISVETAGTPADPLLHVPADSDLPLKLLIYVL